MSKIAALCGLLGAAAGAAVMWGAGGVRSPHEEPRVAPSVASSSDAPAPLPRQFVYSPVTASLGDDDKAALRALIREELKAARPDSPAKPDASQESPEEALSRLPRDGRTAYDEAQGMVGTAVQRGSWTNEDRSELRQRLAQLPVPMRLELVSPLIVAVNKGEVHFEGRGPLF